MKIKSANRTILLNSLFLIFQMIQTENGKQDDFCRVGIENNKINGKPDSLFFNLRIEIQNQNNRVWSGNRDYTIY